MVEPSEGGQTPFANAFGQAIARRGVTLGWLHQRLRSLGTPVSLATLSYWRSGRSQPEHATSLDALRTLDDLLHLPPGHLRSQLSPSRRPGPRRQNRTYGAFIWDVPGAREVFTNMGYSADGQVVLEESSLHLTLDIDETRWGKSMICRSVWRALSEGARGHPDLIELQEPQEGPPEFRAVSGCSLGRSHYDAEHGIYGYEVLLDRHLAVGDTAVTEYVLDFPGEGQTDTMFSQDLTWRISEMVLWARFDPSMMPSTCEAFTTEPDGTTLVHPISLDGTTSAHHVVNNFGPAVVGIRWTW
jgi:hypothetical protein